MQPLRRWSTPQSVHSWWSDSNPLGATIPLHTLAKPLSRLLYHRQALGIIAKRGDDPLSKDTVETLTSYLVYKDILPSTRVLVLDHLTLRASRAESEARVIVEGKAPDCALELLRSSNLDILRSTCRMLETIAYYAELKTAIVELGLCNEIFPLFNNVDVQKAAIRAFPISRHTAGILTSYLVREDILSSTRVLVLDHLAIRASESPVEAGALVDGKVLECALQLFRSSHSDILWSTCNMLKSIAHKDLKITITEVELCNELVSLLSLKAIHVQVAAAIRTFPISRYTAEILTSYLVHEGILPSTSVFVLDYLTVRASESEEEARILVEAKALGCALKLLRSTHPNIRRSTCNMLAKISHHESLAAAVREIEPNTELLALFRHKDTHVSKSKVQAANVLSDDLLTLYMPNTIQFKRGIRSILTSIALDRPFHGTIFLCATPVSILQALANWGQSEEAVHELTSKVLHTVSVICAGSQEGARAAVDANALEHSLRLLISPSPSVICAACRVMAEIARHETLNAAVLQLNPCMRLVSLLIMKTRKDYDNDFHRFYWNPKDYDAIRQDANYTLTCIGRGSREGARSVAVARSLNLGLHATGYM